MSLEGDIKSLVKSLDLELYDTTVVSENDETIYRVSVVTNELDEEGKNVGVNMDKYVELTHLLSPLLDVTPPVSGEYRLEVGSPGIERKLTTIGHFLKSIGEKVFLNTMDKEKFKGTLLKVENSKIFLEVDSKEVEIDFKNILKARTYFEW